MTVNNQNVVSDLGLPDPKEIGLEDQDLVEGYRASFPRLDQSLCAEQGSTIESNIQISLLLCSIIESTDSLLGAMRRALGFFELPISTLLIPTE
jgi:hypothetical protein